MTRQPCPTLAEDLYRFQLVTSCQISPDGRRVVYSLQRVDRETEKTYANLWIVPTAGGRPRQFTYGDQSDTEPQWSPDGGAIAFFSNRKDEKQRQVYVIPSDGGEARPLTQMKGEFGPFQWSPDGKRLTYQFRKKDPDAIAREEDERKKELGVVSRHIRRVFYKLDGSGYLPEERWHLWTIDIQSGEGTQLTNGDVHDELDPRWSPDGKWIAFCSNRSPDPDLDPDAVDLYLIPADGGELVKLPTPYGGKSNPSFSPDGRWLAYLGYEDHGSWWKNQSLWVVPTDGTEGARDLTRDLDLHVASVTASDLPGGLPMTRPTWSGDGRRIHFQVSRHGQTLLQSIAADGDPSTLETAVGGAGTVGAFSFDASQARLAYLYGMFTDPGQVWVREMDAGRVHQRTHVNENLLRGRDLGEVEEVWFKGPEDNDLQGWILKPPGFDASRQYPAVLEIHGGPRAQYGHLFMHEFHALAGRGYIVFFCNPRGGQGYGEAHSKAIVHQWGTADYADLMAWVDLIASKPYVDADRIGVTGGSYGGYMTNWIIGHTDRFRAAVTQRSVSNLVSFYGSSDRNWSFGEEFADQPPWEDFESYWRQSPMRYIGNAKTPTLVLHSEQDLRCPIEQGQQVFVALKTLGVDTEMVVFPEESHGLSRGGRTDRRVERLNHILRWFDRYLRDDLRFGKRSCTL